MDNSIEDELLEFNREDAKDLKLRICLESKILWRIAFPAIITRLTSFGILVVTQSFMGHIGETELASYALVQSILIWFANGIILGMTNALQTLCGQAFGAGRYDAMGIYMQRSWIIVLVTTTILLPLFIFVTPIFRLLGEEEEISVVAGEIALWFIPIVYHSVFNCTFQMFLQAQLKCTIIGWLSSASFVIHWILSWLFVSKWNLGIPGAMGAMIISSCSITIGEFIYVFGGWCPNTWKGLSSSAFCDIFPVVKLSASSGVMICLELWYNAVLVLLAGFMKNATISLSAFSICLNIMASQLMIFLGFSTAACVRVSNELGRGNAEAAKFSVKVIFGTSLSFGVIFWILCLIFDDDLSYLFSSSAEVANAVSSLSILLAFSVLLNSVQPILSGVAIGAGWQSVVAYVNTGCYYGIGVPLGVLLGYVAHLSVKGIWIGMITGVASQTLVLTWMTCRTDWDAQVQKASANLNKWIVIPQQRETLGIVGSP